MTAPPPSRYRVVERGRRLVVIDRTTGMEASRAPEANGAGVAEAAPHRRSLPALPRQVSFDGSSELTTHPLYDAKAPRTIRLDPGSAAVVGRVKAGAIVLALIAITAAMAQPALLAILAIFANKQLRTRVRCFTTRWLDRVEAEAN